MLMRAEGHGAFGGVDALRLLECQEPAVHHMTRLGGVRPPLGMKLAQRPAQLLDSNEKPGPREEELRARPVTLTQRFNAHSSAGTCSWLWRRRKTCLS